MRLTIHVDVDASEVVVATKLLEVLSQLTSNLSVNVRSNTAPAVDTAPTVPIPQAPMEPTVIVSLAQRSFRSLLMSMHVDNASAATKGASSRGNSISFEECIAAINEKISKDFLLSGADGAAPATSSNNATTTPPTTGEEGEKVFNDFASAFQEVAFDPELVKNQRSCLPYMRLLPLLEPESFKIQLRDFLIPRVLKVLTVRRVIDCNRLDFFTYAEAFAALANLEFVNITGAVNTIITLMKKTENRSAAVTMLGKTVEFCLPLLKKKCDAGILDSLMRILEVIDTDIFNYDLNYIKENLLWINSNTANEEKGDDDSDKRVNGTLRGLEDDVDKEVNRSNSRSPRHNSSRRAVGSGVNSNVSSITPPVSLVSNGTFRGRHEGDVFAICYDDVRNELITTAKDGSIYVWNCSTRTLIQTLTIAQHYACSMDINSTRQSLLLCGVAKDKDSVFGGGGASPSIHHYSHQQPPLPPSKTVSKKSSQSSQQAPLPAEWVLDGSIQKPDIKLVSCVKALTGNVDHLFVSGESRKWNGGSVEQLCLYDANSTSNTSRSNGQSSFASITPLRIYDEHEGIITCITHGNDMPEAFFSGSKDCTVRLWDCRSPTSVGRLTRGAVHDGGQHGGKTFDGAAHNDMITCLDSHGHLVVSASLDKNIAVWDIRQWGLLFSARIDSSAVLKAVFGPGGSTVAVATYGGLYSFSLIDSVITMIQPFQDGLRFYDLKWNASRDVLYAAGDNRSVAVFNAVAGDH